MGELIIIKRMISSLRFNDEGIMRLILPLTLKISNYVVPFP